MLRSSTSQEARIFSTILNSIMLSLIFEFEMYLNA
jgi:hypothetical protein